LKNQTYRMTMLYDFYGELLTDRQKEFFDFYYNDDLSLSEIAENAGSPVRACGTSSSGPRLRCRKLRTRPV
jgi:predicted DNA-binding protein YlxM (UPF0122 family)